jgi:hypothetical protein
MRYQRAKLNVGDVAAAADGSWLIGVVWYDPLHALGSCSLASLDHFSSLAHITSKRFLCFLRAELHNRRITFLSCLHTSSKNTILEEIQMIVLDSLQILHTTRIPMHHGHMQRQEHPFSLLPSSTSTIIMHHL